MESQINKITNEELDLIALKNGRQKNSLSIQIPFSYALELVDINWNDILFSISNGYFNNESAIEYAILLLANDENDRKILDLACLNPSEITHETLIKEFLTDFANEVPEKIKAETKDKILYVLLNLLFDDKNKFLDPLFVIEYIYDDFDFPKSIKKFVRYMLLEDDLNLISTTEKIYNNWKEYLHSQKLRFSHTE